jgi:hypothetical protein
MTTINWLMLFKEIITVYAEKHKKRTNIPCGQNAELPNVKGGTYNYHWALNGWLFY